MGMVREFREFASNGSMVDMAIGIMLGGAFGTAIKSLVDNVLMPPIGYLLGGIDFSMLAFELPVEGDDPVLIKYVAFINSLIALFILAIVLFVLVKVVNRSRRKSDDSSGMKLCDECKMEIPAAATRCGHCTSKIAM